MTDILKDEIIALTVEAVEKAYHMGLIAGARAEREACAKVADLVAREIDDTNGIATYIAAAIRARTKGEINT
jgi:hypothetical protein